ncbi:secreted alkaline phosphatase [alpha proteobacterium U9-1i]|nr:secreted alkaline phosphatase [alpha proteobacterium U9-1i]
MKANAKLTRRAALVAGASVAAACARGAETPPYEGGVQFLHGVASGDPQHDRVVIWTRVTPDAAGPVPVRWILSRNRELTDVVKTGIIDATEARDYTVKIDVTGLRAGAPYFYGFRAGQAESMIGKTKTLPRRSIEQVKVAVASCASYTHGFFNAYAALAQQTDLDAVIHLGDYIYEYGINGYGGAVGLRLGRVLQPEVECLSLADYRLRHAQAKREEELQAAHAIAPWIVVWDDHETANDLWSTGAENHSASEGAFAARKQAALQAYYEWMPIRDPERGRAFEAINRSFRFGDVMTLIMLETRLLARTQPLDYNTTFPIAMQRWDFANPAQPIALRDTEADTPAMRRLPAIFEVAGGEIRPVLDWRRAQNLVGNAQSLPQGFFLGPDMTALDALMNDPERQLMGQAQEQWLARELAASKNASVAWQVLGNQVLMSKIIAPDLSRTPPALAQALEALQPGVSRLLGFTRWPIPVTPDGWDGYAANRARVLDMIRNARANTLVLTGDSHAAWANEVQDRNGRAAVELGTTSITSASNASYFAQVGIDFADGLRLRNPHIKWTDQEHHGFLVVTLNNQEALAEYFVVSTVSSKEFETSRAAAFTIANTTEGAGEITPAG